MPIRYTIWISDLLIHYKKSALKMSFTKSTPPDMPRGQAENCSLLKLYSFSIYRIILVSVNSYLSSLSSDLGDFYQKFLECSEKSKVFFWFTSIRDFYSARQMKRKGEKQALLCEQR